MDGASMTTGSLSQALGGLRAPNYMEGSCDVILLEQNVVSGQGMGYRVEKERLSRFSLARLSV